MCSGVRVRFPLLRDLFGRAGTPKGNEREWRHSTTHGIVARVASRRAKQDRVFSIRHIARISASPYSVNAYHVAGHLRDARRAIDETSSSLSATNGVVKNNVRIDGYASIRGCARRHDARAVPGCSFCARDAKVRAHHRTRHVTRTTRVSLRAHPRAGGSVSFCQRLPDPERETRTDGWFPNAPAATRRRFPPLSIRAGS